MAHATEKCSGSQPAILSASLLDLRSYPEVQESVDKYLDKGFSYSRTNNPTVSTSLALALGSFWNLLMSGGTFPGTPCGNPESNFLSSTLLNRSHMFWDCF